MPTKWESIYLDEKSTVDMKIENDGTVHLVSCGFNRREEVNINNEIALKIANLIIENDKGRQEEADLRTRCCEILANRKPRHRYEVRVSIRSPAHGFEHLFKIDFSALREAFWLYEEKKEKLCLDQFAFLVAISESGAEEIIDSTSGDVRKVEALNPDFKVFTRKPPTREYMVKVSHMEDQEPTETLFEETHDSWDEACSQFKRKRENLWHNQHVCLISNLEGTILEARKW